MQDASTMVADEGKKLDLAEDPPAVVKREVDEAVKRWRWRRIIATFPSMQAVGANTGGEMFPFGER